MELIRQIISAGDLFQVLGEIECEESGIPIIHDQKYITYKNGSLSLDISPLLTIGTEKRTVDVRSLSGAYLFTLSIENNALNGPCILLYEGKIVCAGFWKNGLRHGHFITTSNETILFDGYYENGLRAGLANIRQCPSLVETPVTLSYLQGSSIFNYTQKINSGLFVYGYSKNFELRECGFYSPNNQRDGLFLTIDKNLPVKEQLWEANRLLFNTKSFVDQNMICFDKNENPTFMGPYKWTFPMKYVPHGECIQYLRQHVYYKGGFVDGLRCGTGILFYANNQFKYKGEWKDDLPNGKGIIYHPDGKKCFAVKCKAGKFKRGFRVYDVFSFSFKNYYSSHVGIILKSEQFDMINPSFLPSMFFTQSIVGIYQDDIDILQAKSMGMDLDSQDNHPAMHLYFSMKSLLSASKLFSINDAVKAKEIVIPANTQLSSFIWGMQLLESLEIFKIGSNSLQNESSFVILSAHALRVIQIEHNCFLYNKCENKSPYTIRSSYSNNFVVNPSSAGLFLVADCPHLQSIEIGPNCFRYFHEMMIESR